MSDYEKLTWRVGGKVPLNVYEGDTPMFQCHTPEHAKAIVALLNAGEKFPAYRDALAMLVSVERPEPKDPDLLAVVAAAKALDTKLRCIICGSPAYFHGGEGVWRHAGEPHQQEYLEQNFCDRYGYPIQVPEHQAELEALREALAKLAKLEERGS